MLGFLKRLIDNPEAGIIMCLFVLMIALAVVSAAVEAPAGVALSLIVGAMLMRGLQQTLEITVRELGLMITSAGTVFSLGMVLVCVFLNSGPGAIWFLILAAVCAGVSLLFLPKPKLPWVD